MSAAKDYTAVPGAVVPDRPDTGDRIINVEPVVIPEGKVLALSGPSGPSRMDVLANIVSRLNGDVDKVERIMKLVTEAEAKDHERAFISALRRCQMEMTPIAADAASDKGKYATYFALDRAIRHIYTAQGFAVTFSTADSAADSVKVLGFLLHDAGHTREYQWTVPADGKGPKGNDVMTRTHAAASAMTYGKRYLLVDMFNLPIDKDDDGRAAGAVNNAQTETLLELIEQSGADQKEFCKHFGVATVMDLPKKEFQRACDMLRRKAKAPQKVPEYLE